MPVLNKRVFFLLALITLPFYCQASMLMSSGVHTIAKIMALLNFVVLINSVISMKQFFFPGDINRTVYQIGNIVLIVLFYFVSLSFLFSNKEYYDGYEQLDNVDCIRKVFLSLDIYSVMQWVIILALVINIIYIKKYGKDYYKG